MGGWDQTYTCTCTVSLDDIYIVSGSGTVAAQAGAQLQSTAKVVLTKARLWMPPLAMYIVFLYGFWGSCIAPKDGA